MTRTYWRSLGQLEERPESRAFLEREFPEGASELPEGVTRRDMMTLLGASLSLAGLAGCRRPVEEIVPFVTAPEEIVPGIPRYYATTMPFRRSAYGLIVESHEGRPTKIEGNPSHPSTLGASSSRVQASVLGLYDPDRSQSVTQKGARKSWSDFVTAWGELSKAHAADGAGLAVLSESFSSPTLARLASEFRARYPRAVWATYEAVSDENRLAGLRSATGRDLDLMLRIDQASVILALDADPLLTDPEMIRHTRGFAAGRRAGVSGGAMNRLYAVEGVYSLTGAMADHRLRLESRQIAPFLAALAARLVPPAAGAASQAEAGVPGVDPRWLDALAKDLLANRGKGLIVAGERQPAAVHAAVCALNTSLGNTGKTVSYYETRDAALPSVSSLASLVSAMKGGAVQTLVVLGGNPVFDAPADLDFASAMAKVPHAIALGHSVDETSSKAEWHVPRAHYLESWGDARAVGGTLSVVQPLILPLFGGKTAVEVLGLMVGGKDRPGYDILRETWKPILGEAEFDSKWNRVLHDGFLSGSELPEVVPDFTAQPLAELASPIGGGARRWPGDRVPPLPLASRRPLRERRVAAGASRSPHQAHVGQPRARKPEDRRDARSCERGCGPSRSCGPLARASRLDPPGHGGRCSSPHPWLRSSARGTDWVRGRVRHVQGPSLPGTWLRQRRQAHQARPHLPALGDAGARQHGGAPRRARVDPGRASIESRGGGASRTPGWGRGSRGAAARRQEAPGALGVFEEDTEHFSLWKEHTYDQGHQWGMTIDLNACIGCNACMTACQSENNVPVVGKAQVAKGREMHWIRVDRYFSGEPDASPEMVFQPIPCMHCEDAPCEQVCPVAATVHDAQGLNVMVYNRCIGTRYCSNNCPYKVRRFNFFNFTKDTPDILKLAMNPDVTVRARGVMEKCTYCTQRINRVKIDARLAGREIRDGDVKTACQQACPASAIEFGDIRDQSSRVGKAKADPRNYALLEELNTKPRTTYLAKVRNPNPDLEGPA